MFHVTLELNISKHLNVDNVDPSFVDLISISIEIMNFMSFENILKPNCIS